MFAPTDIRYKLDQLRTKTSVNKIALTKNNFKIDKIDANRIYHIDQIKKICIDYRLRFLDANLFKGQFPIEAVEEIKVIEKTHQTELTSLKMMAPSKLFKLENADDPLLFAPMGNGYYYLIHQWGNDLHPLRKFLVWPFKNLITMCIAILAGSFLLSFFVPLSVFTSNPTTSDFFLIYFFMFKSVAAIVIYYTFARGKNVSQAIWNSKYYNN
ncbi:MAG: Uncharacterised protein [Bacteroidota bacterium]|nr:MAG: Uncharacterised protein [Bacteroidota bacterium]